MLQPICAGVWYDADRRPRSEGGRQVLSLASLRWRRPSPLQTRPTARRVTAIRARPRRCGGARRRGWERAYRNRERGWCQVAGVRCRMWKKPAPTKSAERMSKGKCMDKVTLRHGQIMLPAVC